LPRAVNEKNRLRNGADLNEAGYKDFLSRVKKLVETRIVKMTSLCDCVIDPASFMPGKMLRTRMAARLIASDHDDRRTDVMIAAGAATELVHTASLCHDDVIDNALIRRGIPTTWRVSSRSSAVLAGDLLLCEAIDTLTGKCESRYLTVFISKVREICVAEIEQELALRGSLLNEKTCIRLARGKTGPLFAFIGSVYGAEVPALSSALEEAGYLIGTAYQLADDLLDIVGDEELSGKTLGSDLRRGKYTIAQCFHGNRSEIHEKIANLCVLALDCLTEWPKVRKSIEIFFENDLQPVFERIDTGLKMSL